MKNEMINKMNNKMNNEMINKINNKMNNEKNNEMNNEMNNEINNINLRYDIRFITCFFGVDEIKSNNRIRKYFQVLDYFVPYANITFAVSEFTKINPIVLQYKNIAINIERFGNITKKELLYKYPKSFIRYYFNGMRYSFYSQYLKNHSEIKYVIISDDDTLFFRDPFLLIKKDPNVVHLMEDVFPFSVTEDRNYIWTNAWNNLDQKIKEKCGFKQLNITLLSDENKNKIPLNSGLLIGRSKNIIKIVDLISTKLICSGIFKDNAEQGLLNYLDLSGELKELNIPFKRHNVYNDSIISCPEFLPINKYIQQINSSHFIALHHYHRLKYYYILRTPKEFKPFLQF
jgi:hypothetical protein